MIIFLRKSCRLFKAPEYEAWFNKQTDKEKAQISERLSKIEEEGYFGNNKQIDDHTSELKWKNGRRVYYALIIDLNILILLGGNKNGQSKDIAQAKSIFRKYTES